MSKIFISAAISIALVFTTAVQVYAIMPCPEDNPDCKSTTSIGASNDMYVAQQDNTVDIILPAVVAFMVVTASVTSYIIYKKKHNK